MNCVIFVLMNGVNFNGLLKITGIWLVISYLHRNIQKPKNFKN